MTAAEQEMQQVEGMVRQMIGEETDSECYLQPSKAELTENEERMILSYYSGISREEHESDYFFTISY